MGSCVCYSLVLFTIQDYPKFFPHCIWCSQVFTQWQWWFLSMFCRVLCALSCSYHGLVMVSRGEFPGVSPSLLWWFHIELVLDVCFGQEIDKGFLIPGFVCPADEQRSGHIIRPVSEGSQTHLKHEGGCFETCLELLTWFYGFMCFSDALWYDIC